MELTILGAHGTWPGAGGATSGLLVRHEGFSMWIDAGTGTMANLQRHIDLFDVGAVMISHSHPDHVSDLYAYLMARLFSPEHPPKIPIYLAPKVAERFNPLLTDDSADMRLAEAFDVVVVETVGVGQSETDVEEVCDTVAVVVEPAPMTFSSPEGGIMEVPDILWSPRRTSASSRSALAATSSRRWRRSGRARSPCSPSPRSRPPPASKS